MTARYYVAKPDEEGRLYQPPLFLPPTGPYATYPEAIAVHARELAAETFPTLPRVARSVLLDLGSVPNSGEQELKRILLTDPLLHAIFELGRDYGIEHMRRRQP